VTSTLGWWKPKEAGGKYNRWIITIAIIAK
jgi:hypothetical protein